MTRTRQPTRGAEKVVGLAPPHPYVLECPECAADGLPLRYPRYRHSMSEQWGCVVTRHDYYYCRTCRHHFVSTNGHALELADTSH